MTSRTIPHLLIVFALSAALARAESSDGWKKEGNRGMKVFVAGETNPASPTEVAVRFARLKRRQMQEMAKANNLAIPPVFNRLFDAVERADWPASSNIWVELKSRAGQYEGNQGDAAIDTVLWQPVLETHGFFEQVNLWEPGLLADYANRILSALAPGTVYFGGTDPGRFVITAYRDVYDAPDAFVITQNALADHRYMEYVRGQFADRLWIPSQQDCRKAFEQYVDEVKSGKRSACPGISVKDGRIKVTGVAGVMEINGILARQIFEKNRDAHEFYVEESYVIRWMYPYLEPDGLLMRIRPEPAPLDDAAVAASHTFWDELASSLQANPRFGTDEAARKSYSKLRSASAGLFAHHDRLQDAQTAFEQAVRLYPASPEASMRYVQDVLLKQKRFAEARQVLETFVTLAPENDKAADFLVYVKRLQADHKRITELETRHESGKMAAGDALELAELYLKTRNMARFDSLASALEQNTQLPADDLFRLAKLLHEAKRHTSMEIVLARVLMALPEEAPSKQILDVVRLHVAAKQYDAAARAMMSYLQREPRKWKSWVDLAALGTVSDTGVDSEWALVNAIEVGGDDARDLIRKDKRFRQLLDAPAVSKALAGK